MSKIKINLARKSYFINIGSNILESVGEIVSENAKPTKALVISNKLIAKHYESIVSESLKRSGIESDLICVPSGERFKTLKTISSIYEELVDRKFDRKSALIALGGGVIGDMVGFAAATYMRGIDFYQVPTTLLAQVDASVGGKTGVDLPQGKNLVGAFYQPKSVIIDISTLGTLPSRELRCGLAEVVKHGIIYDKELFRFVDCHSKELLAKNVDALNYVVKRSVEIKRDVVVQDEYESGIRAILNYGHTIGHAVETLSGYGKYRHGEAVAIGMIIEALIAEYEGIIQKGSAGIISDVIGKLRLPIELDRSIDPLSLIRAIELDKKTLGGKIRMALPSEIGKCRIVENVGRETILEAIEAHRDRRLKI